MRTATGPGRGYGRTIVYAPSPQDVLAVERRYYDAFERQDFDAISDLWEHSDRVFCCHPGWMPLNGWSSVAASYLALFESDLRMQFLLTEEKIWVEGKVAWLTVEENILGDQGGATVSVQKVLVDEDGDGSWRYVSHHATLVSPPTEDV